MSRCNDDLKKLLKSWKLENIFTHLVAQDIDVEVLQIIKPCHLVSLLHSFTLGTQIRFEHNLEKWRSDIGKPLNHQNNQQFGNHLQLKQIVQNILNEINGQQTNGSRNESTSKLNNSKYPLIDLKSIIFQYPPEGPEIFEIYHRKNKFSSSERNFLINLIVRHYVKHDLDFNLNISYAIEEAILRLFPNESLDMYRNGEQGIVYNKYLEYKVENSKKERIEMTVDPKIEEISNASNEENVQEQNVFPGSDNNNEESDNPNEILLQTLCNGCKRFVKIFEPYSYQGFILAACMLFDISSTRDYYIAVNGCEISEDEFKNVILQYYKLPAFIIELKKKAIPVISRNFNESIDDFENSCSATNIFEESLDSSTPTKSYEPQTVQNNSYMSRINTFLPDANDIRNIPTLMHIVKLSDDGKILKNKHRCAIAKAIIDEILNPQPDRLIRRQDFYTLTDNIIKVFPNEVQSTYYIPSQNKERTRGKLWYAYTNRRREFINAEICEPRSKRKHQSDAESEKTNDKIYVTDYFWENNEFSLNTTLDWSTVQHKWSSTHRERRDELLKGKLQPKEYMNKYSILKSNRGIELMEIDVNILYPTVVGIDNWLLSYKRIVEKGQQLTNMEKLNQILSSIENSNDERYRASLALLIIPYIFPSTSRSSDINREDIQKRFIKEYKSLEDLKSDTDCQDLQIRFVHNGHQINYAEFTICDINFKCVDLLEALNTIFNYILALNLEYPTMCLHIWQFIQLAIFQIEIPEVLEPKVMSIFNELCGT